MLHWHCTHHLPIYLRTFSTRRKLILFLLKQQQILNLCNDPLLPWGAPLFQDDRFDRYDRLDRYPGPSASDRDRDRYQPGFSPNDRYPGDRYRGDRYPGDRYPGVLVGPRPTPYRPDPAAGFASRPGGFYNNYSGVRGPSNSPYRDYDNYNRGYGLNRA